LVLVVPTLVIAGIFLSQVSPGGMRPSYQATDRDPRLTRAARSATKLIAALERYHEDHHEFPSDGNAAALGAGWGEEPSMEDWNYRRTPAGYHLWHKLGWDPALIYELDGVTGRWIFDPGDGSPTKTIVLSP
jgi:hypothetical protein